MESHQEQDKMIIDDLIKLESMLNQEKMKLANDDIALITMKEELYQSKRLLSEMKDQRVYHMNTIHKDKSKLAEANNDLNKARKKRRQMLTVLAEEEEFKLNQIKDKIKSDEDKIKMLSTNINKYELLIKIKEKVIADMEKSIQTAHLNIAVPEEDR